MTQPMMDLATLRLTVEKAKDVVRQRLKVPGLKAALKAGGGRVYGNKPELIERLIVQLDHQLAFSPETLQVSLHEIAQGNGGTLDVYGSSISSYSHSPSSNRHYSTSHPLAGMKPSKIALPPRPNMPNYHPLGSAGTVPKTPVPRQTGKPFDGISYPPSAFHIFQSRLYQKVVDGRSGHMSITDFVMVEKTVQLLLSKNPVTQQREYGVKLYMANPQLIQPFGVSKMIDPNYTEGCFVTVNGSQVDPTKIIPLKKKTWACVPPDITDFLILKAGAQNRIELRFGYMHPRALVTLELVKLVSIGERISLICENHKLTKEKVLAERQQKLKQQMEDDDIQATFEVICFKDPILQTRISKPGRSSKCRHTQCFDLPTFFTMNYATPTYTCPVCNSKVKWEDVVLDGFFAEILEKVGEEVDTVEIQPDGSWAPPIKIKQEDSFSTSVSKPEKRKRETEIVCLDDDEDEDPDDDRPLSRRRIVANVRTPEPDVIDLTLSDDDDGAQPVSTIGAPTLETTHPSTSMPLGAPTETAANPTYVSLPLIMAPARAPVATSSTTPRLAQPSSQYMGHSAESTEIVVPMSASSSLPLNASHDVLDDAQLELVRELELALENNSSGSAPSSRGSSIISSRRPSVSKTSHQSYPGFTAPHPNPPLSLPFRPPSTLSQQFSFQEPLGFPPVHNLTGFHNGALMTTTSDDNDDVSIPSPTASTIEAMEQTAAATESLLSGLERPEQIQLTPSSPVSHSSVPESSDPLVGFANSEESSLKGTGYTGTIDKPDNSQQKEQDLQGINASFLAGLNRPTEPAEFGVLSFPSSSRDAFIGHQMSR